MVSYSTKGGTIGGHVDSYHVFLVQGQGARSWTVGRDHILDEAYIDGLRPHEELLRRYEGHLGSMRQQSALLYKEHMESVEKSVDSEKRLNRQIDELRGEREALTLRVTRYQELAALEEKESSNPSSVHKALRDLTRRVTVHEVNEQTLARKYGSLESQLKVEAEARVRAENSLVEIEVSSRKRILYLEQWKSYSVELTERLQRQLAKSVPDSEHNKVLRELEMIREDYLDLLHKEADVRLRLTEQKDLPRKLKRYQHIIYLKRSNILIFKRS